MPKTRIHRQHGISTHTACGVKITVRQHTTWDANKVTCPKCKALRAKELAACLR